MALIPLAESEGFRVMVTELLYQPSLPKVPDVILYVVDGEIVSTVVLASVVIVFVSILFTLSVAIIQNS